MGMREVSQSDLCWREEKLARRSVREPLNDRRELLERKRCIGCKRIGGRERRKMMRKRERPNTFNKAFIGKLVDRSYEQPRHWQNRPHHIPFYPQFWNDIPREARIFGTIALRVVVALPFLDRS